MPPSFDELRTVTVSSRPARTIEAVVRRRGIDVGFGERRLSVQSEEAVTLIVREPDTLRRVAMPQTDDRGRMMALVGAPLAALLVGRLFRAKRSR